MARILIVDDSKTSRRILKNILTEYGHELVGEGTNGQEGFDLYRKLKPDIVTLDITMPVMDGVEALKKIIEFDPQAKVIMVTAAGQRDNVMTAIKAGAFEFVTKPFDEVLIKNVFTKALEQ